MPAEWIDAEFEVVEAPLRAGDRHPTRCRWRYTGRNDAWGRPLWYRPPVFHGWKLYVAGILAAGLLWLLVNLALEVLQGRLP